MGVEKKCNQILRGVGVVDGLVDGVCDIIVETHYDPGSKVSIGISSRELPVDYAANRFYSELRNRGYNGSFDVRSFDTNGKYDVVIDLDKL